MNADEFVPLSAADSNESSISTERASLPHGYPAWIDRELLDLTEETWRGYYGEPLTETELGDILVNVGRLLDHL